MYHSNTEIQLIWYHLVKTNTAFLTAFISSFVKPDKCSSTLIALKRITSNIQGFSKCVVGILS